MLQSFNFPKPISDVTFRSLIVKPDVNGLNFDTRPHILTVQESITKTNFYKMLKTRRFRALHTPASISCTVVHGAWLANPRTREESLSKLIDLIFF